MTEDRGFRVRLPLPLRKFIKHEKNIKVFSEYGFVLKDDDDGRLSILASGESADVEEAEKIFDLIIKNYNDIITDSVELPKDVVAFFRGTKSHHLDKCKEKCCIKNIYFNNIENSDMVKCLVTGERDAINRFMREILKSWSILTQKK